MPICAWITDSHLNLVDDNEIADLGRRAARADLILISGDVSEGSTRADIVTLQRAAGKRIYFVLGNHDVYGTSFDAMQDDMRDLTFRSGGNINWLPACGVVELTPKTALIGHDSWYDALAGDWMTSDVRMRDWSNIAEFGQCMGNQAMVIGLCRRQAGRALDYVFDALQAAFEKYDNVLLVTHVPPFVETSRRHGDNGLPFYSAPSMGRMLLEEMTKRPTKTLTVISGHTHEAAHFQPARNLKAYVGSASYYHPDVYTLLDIR